jgi:hypothetical protein
MFMPRFTEGLADSGNDRAEKQAMQRHYEYYKSLADSGQLKEQDQAQWRLALERKQHGLVE